MGVWDDNIKTDLREMGYQWGVRIEVAQEYVDATMIHKWNLEKLNMFVASGLEWVKKTYRCGHENYFKMDVRETEWEVES